VSAGLPLPDPEALQHLRAAGIDAPLAERLAVYAALVLAANRRVNLTGAKTGAAFADHILDALTLRDDVESPLIDVGSGNGIPGIPLALATGARITLLEPIKKRARFLETALDALAIDGTVVAARAEDAARDPAQREAYRTATARAIGSAPAVAELTTPFLEIGGRALLQRGNVEPHELIALEDAALVLGSELIDDRSLEGQRRVLILIKRSATNRRFPRRDGIPNKRPLCS
jgi:16S rRNA (guanine527-N7)-methyltransferase